MNLASRYEAEIMIYGFMRIPLGKFETSCAFLFSQIFFHFISVTIAIKIHLKSLRFFVIYVSCSWKLLQRIFHILKKYCNYLKKS